MRCAQRCITSQADSEFTGVLQTLLNTTTKLLIWDINTKDYRVLLWRFALTLKVVIICLVSIAFYPDSHVFLGAVSLSSYHLVMIVFPLYFLSVLNVIRKNRRIDKFNTYIRVC